MFLLAAYKSNVYIDPSMNIIIPSTHVVDLGISMSSDCTFDLHISNFYRRCSNLAGWILRTFTMRDPHLMALVLSRLDYASQLWSPYLLKHIYLIEKVQRAFTKHISGLRDFSYSKRLETIDIASYMCGKLLKDWLQTSLILSPVLSLIVGDVPVLYTMPVLVDWAP